MQLSFADSEIAGVDTVDGVLQVRLAAASVEVDGQAAWASGVVLRVEGARLLAGQAPWLGRIRDGVLRSGLQAWRGGPLPWRCDGPLVLELDLANGSVLEVAGTAFTADSTGTAEVRASLAC